MRSGCELAGSHRETEIHIPDPTFVSKSLPSLGCTECSVTPVTSMVLPRCRERAGVQRRGSRMGSGKLRGHLAVSRSLSRALLSGPALDAKVLLKVRPIGGRMSAAPDLNAIREAMLSAQRENLQYPTDASKVVTVRRDGKMQLGPGQDRSTTSRVQQGTFAAHPPAHDLAVAQTKMPANTRWIEAGGVKGWTYTITTEIGSDFTMLAFSDGAQYKVLLVSPEIEGRYNAHNAHLYSDGTICLSDRPGSGQPTLEEAYSKSVLWANGMAFHMKGHAFPFSINNL